MSQPRSSAYPLQALAWGIGLAFVAMLVAATPVRAQSCPGADVVEAAANGLNQAAATGSPQAYGAVVDRFTNVPSLAMFALGPYQGALTAGQRSEYVRLTRDYIVRMVADQAGSLDGSSVQILTCYSQGGHAFVDTSIGGRRVVWRIGGGQIQDVNMNGVWLAPQLRSSFVSVVRRSNGDVAALIQYLRSYTLALR